MAEIRTTSSTGGQKGTKLARFDLIPVGPLTALAEHYGVGASKYADNQWRNGYEWSKTYAALMRHLTAWWAGFDYDVCSNDPGGCSHVDTEGRPFVAIREDACFNHTGSHHLAAVAWHAFAGLEFVERFPQHDDRYHAVVPIVPETGTSSGLPGGLGDLTDEGEDERFAPFKFAADVVAFQEVISEGIHRLYAMPHAMPRVFIVHEDGDIDLPDAPFKLDPHYGPDLLRKHRSLGM